MDVSLNQIRREVDNRDVVALDHDRSLKRAAELNQELT
jgi:hypothetical protein